jgi:hypothetical protein
MYLLINRRSGDDVPERVEFLIGSRALALRRRTGPVAADPSPLRRRSPTRVGGPAPHTFAVYKRCHAERRA